MAQGNNNINFKLNFEMGDKQAFNTLKAQLNEIRALASDVNFGLGPEEMQSTLRAANTLEQALTRAYDPTLNTINIQKFNNILKQSGLNATTLQSELANVGAVGQQAFLKATAQLMQFNTATKQTNKFLNDIANSLFNTIKYTAFNAVINNITKTVQHAYSYVKDLDTSLNDIRIVTGKSADDMADFAKEANNAAKALAVTTNQYTEGALIYYQQGLDEETVKTLTDITAKTSNVTQQSMSTVSEQLTAVQNGYKVANQAAKEGMGVYEEYVDKMAAVGASTASDLEELSIAMSKVASAASAMGVGFDDLNAQIATIVSVTRQAPESVGTALKTIYARLGDLKVDGVDEFGTKLGDVSKQLQTMGINIVDQMGNMRNMSDVIAEVAQKWDTWTSAQRQAAAIAMAGKRQYNNLIALFDNQDMYGEALETSMEAAGTLEKQQEIAMDSLANKMDILKATAEDLYDSLFNTDTISDFVEGGTEVLKFLTKFVDGVGGLNNILPMLLFSMTQLFSGQIANGLGTIVNNLRIAKEETAMMKQNAEQLKVIFADSSLIQNMISQGPSGIAAKAGFEELKTYYTEMQKYQGIMTQEEKAQQTEILNTIELLGRKNVQLAEEKYAQENNANALELIDKKLLEDTSQLGEFNRQADNLSKIADEMMTKLQGRGIQLIDPNTKQFDSIAKTLKEIGIEINNVNIDKLSNRFKVLVERTHDAQSALEILVREMKDAGQGGVSIANLTNEVNTLRGALDNVKASSRQSLDTKLLIDNITSTVSSLGQLAMSIQTIKNLGSIQTNEDIDFGEKMLQTMMNLSFILPGLTQAYANFKKVFNLTGILDLMNAKHTAHTAALMRDTAAQELYNAASKITDNQEKQRIANIGALITEEELEAVATGEMEAADLAANKVQKSWLIISKEGQLVIEKDIAFKIADAKATEEAAAATLTFKAAILPTIIAVSALIAVISIVSKVQEEQAKIITETNEKRIEEANAIQEQVDANESLYKSYIKTYEAYKENTATKEDMKKVTDDLLESYDLENNKLAVLTGNYEALTKAIKEKRIAELEDAKESAADEKNAAKSNILENSQVGSDASQSKDKLQLQLSPYQYQSESNDANEEFANALSKNLKGNVQFAKNEGNVSGRVLEVDKDNVQDIIDLYDTLDATIKQLQSSSSTEQMESGEYKDAKDQMAQMAPYIEEYRKSIEDFQKYSAQLEVLNIDQGKITNIEDFKNVIETLKNALKDSGLEDEGEIDSIINKYVSQQGGKAESFLKETNIIEAIAEQIGETYDQFKEYQDGLSPEKKKLILDGNVDLHLVQSKKDIESEIQLAFEDYGTFDVTAPVELAGTLASGNKLKKADKEKLGDLNAEAESAMGGFEQKGTYHQMEVIDEITQYRIDKNEEYLHHTEKVIEKELELRKKEQSEIFATEEEYTKKKEQLKINEAVLKYNGEFLSDERKKEIEEENKKLREKVELYEELAGIIDGLENFDGLNFEEIEGIGFSDLISDLDMIVNKSELIKSAAELIGEGFTVAASDVEKFSNMFPELLENVTVLTDGSLKLDKEVLNTRLGDIKTEMEARTKAKIEEIDQQIALKEIEETYLKRKLKNLTSYLKGEQTAQETINDINEAGYEYRTGLEELTGQNIKDLEATAINSSNNEGKALVEMLDIVGAGFAQAAKAHYAMINGQDFDWQGLNFSGTAVSAEEFSLSFGAESEAAKLRAKAQQEYDEIYAKAQETQKQLNMVTGELDELRAKKGVLQSTGQAAMNALDRVSQGKAGKEDKKSGSKKDKDKDQKEQEDEFDRYQEIKKAIEAVDNALKKLDKDQENLYGYELIASLKQENELLEQQAANYERLYEMQQQEAAELRDQLGTMGLMFDASGAITNYAAATSAALQQYAAAIEQYNAGLMDETTFKVYEKSYENFKKLLDRYDKLYYTEMQNTQDKLDEIRRKELANNLKAWEVEIQIHLDKEKMKRDWNDFLKDIKQDFRKVFSDLTIDVKYDEKNFKSFVNDVGTTLKAVGDVEAEIDKMMGGGSSDMFESVSQAQEKLKELQEQLLDQGKSLRELYKQVQETYLNGIDQVKDKFEELMKIYERFNNELEYHRQLIELLYGDKAYDLMDKYYEAQSKNINAQIDSLRKQTNMWKDEFQKSYEHAIKSGSKVDINDFTTQTEDMKKAYENMLESQQDLNDLVLEGVKILQDQYLNTINKIMDAMDKAVQGKDGFEGMKSNQEFMQKMAEEYLDDVEGAAKIQTFANQMDMDKANASNLKAQQKIQAFREKEIKTLREKENLTQADIDLAEARYQLMLKEIALEDAQNNKTSMKLTRNEQGNQSYQYVADEDDTAQKQQDLLQQYSDLYKLADDSYNHSLELAMSLQEEYVEKYREIAENTTLTEEQKLQKQQELYDQYYPQFVAAAQNAELYKQEAMMASAGVFQTVCEQDSTAYNTLTEEQKRLVDELKDKNFEDYDAMRTALIEEFYPDLNKTAEEVFGDLNINSQTTAAQVIGDQAKDSDSVKNEINKAVNAMQKAIQDYEKELDKLQEVAGIDFSQVGNYIDQVSQKIDNMSGTTEKMVSDSSSYLDELRRVLDGVAQAQDSVIQQILDAQRAIQEYLALMGQANRTSAPNYSSPHNGGGLPDVTGNGGGDGSKNPGGKKGKASENGYTYYTDPNGAYGTVAISGPGGSQIIGGADPNVPGSYQAILDKQAKSHGFESFKTGGYTGQQSNGDSDGHFAMLHQKELVLNADDTKNFLSGINIIRDMTSLNGSISNAITTAVANMVLSLSKVNAGTGPSTIDHKADAAPNIFNITAEFPNANDVNEIREAILSLPNLASQRVGYNLR